MISKSSIKAARISPQKCREVARVIQGRSVNEAKAILSVTPRKAARILLRALNNAMSSALHTSQAIDSILYVKSATAEIGPKMKRFNSRARGSASPIIKRTTHVNIVIGNVI